jgi:hypothetical protein
VPRYQGISGFLFFLWSWLCVTGNMGNKMPSRGALARQTTEDLKAWSCLISWFLFGCDARMSAQTKIFFRGWLNPTFWGLNPS